MPIHNFRKLDIWLESMVLTKEVYKIISSLPTEEKYGISSQISRCAISIPSNIAEGSGRNTNQDFNRFLSISLGSSYELETQLLLIQDLYGLDCANCIDKCQQIQRMINGFKSKIVLN